ncbi:MAG: endonuclease MutS2, partial [Firmicutes bacterium]|nr:endonuclease MutS2 [Bacillota bacterium]
QSDLNLCHKNALTALEWDSVLYLASSQADTVMGHEAVKQLAWAENPEVLHQQQILLQEVLQWIAWQPLTLRGAGPVGTVAEQARKGHVLTPDELWMVADTLLRAYEVVTTIPEPQCPVWRERVTHWVVPRELATVIRAILTPEGEVRDDASPALRDIRRKRRATLGEIDTTLHQLLRSPRWAPYLQEPVVTVRFGRRVVPVKYMFRNSVSGIVHDQSASGQTVFVEPLSIVERQNAVVSLERDEQEEIERILQDLSQRVGSFNNDLAFLQQELTDLDRVLALARYGTAHEGVIPHVGGENLILVDSRHPLLDNPVPLSLRLDAEKRILVITGPNTGGKTVALKTAGLMVAFALSGMMVPAREGTRIPFITGILADIGDEQSLEQNL